MKKLIIFGALGLLLLGAAGGGAMYWKGMFDSEAAAEQAESAEAEAPEGDKEEGRESREEDANYVEMRPLTAPVFKGNKVLFNLMLTFTIEVDSFRDKETVARMLPRIRDAMIRELYAHGITRHVATQRFDLDSAKSRMLKIAQTVVDKKKVRDILVISAIRIN